MSLRYALLGLISKKPQTGYELYQTFQQQIIYFWNSTHSQIYTELRKMEQDEVISSELIYQEGSPNKKKYTITKEGEKDLIHWILEQKIKPAKIKDEFLIRASAFHLLSIDEILGLLDTIIEREQQILEGTLLWQSQHIEQEQPKFEQIGEYITSEYGIMYAKMYIDWCLKVKDILSKMDLEN